MKLKELKSKVFDYFDNNFSLAESTNGFYRFADPESKSKGQPFAFSPTYLTVRDFRDSDSISAIDFIASYEGITVKEVYKSILDNYNPNIDLHISVAKSSFYLPTIEYPKYFADFVTKRKDLTICNKVFFYLRKRKLDPYKLVEKGFGYCYNGDWLGYIIVPLVQDGELKSYFGRSVFDYNIRYKNKEESLASHLLYNGDALKKYKDVFILEGWTDSETMGDNAVATLNWSISDTQFSQLIKSDCECFTIIADKGYAKHAYRNAYRLAEFKKVKVLTVDEFDGKDVNEIGYIPILNKFNTLNPLKRSEIIKIINAKSSN